MKKIIIVSLILFFALSSMPFSYAFSENKAESPGAYLKKIGIVKGFPDGSLDENGYITQAEYLSLVSRTLKAIKTVKRGNLVKQSNFFDRIINKAYHAYLILRYKLMSGYYRTYMWFSRRPGSANKNDWYFEDLVYLKINGFDIPKDFRPDAVISEGYALSWAMKALGLGKESENIVAPKDVEQNATYFVLSVEHGMQLDGVSTARPLKRRDAFNLIVKIIGK